MSNHKVLAINPGSTSTKIAVFRGEEAIYSENVSFDPFALGEESTLDEQAKLRIEAIQSKLEADDVDLSETEAVVVRSTGLVAVRGGVYEVNDAMQADGMKLPHPARFGTPIGRHFADKLGCSAYVVNPPDTDEFQDVSRLTGIKGVYRVSRLHALNLKETAIRHSGLIGKRYDECNFVVCHLGGGVSVSAHREGLMIDGNDIAAGDGPMTPTRSGSVSVFQLMQLVDELGTTKPLVGYAVKNGGLTSLLGTADAREVERRISEGDKAAKLAWDAMIYQICKAIGSMAAALCGEVDGILLGGGLVHSEELVDQVTRQCSWIAPVYAYPGEFEMEAMAAGVCRILDGEEELLEYTGVPTWDGFGEIGL